MRIRQIRDALLKTPVGLLGLLSLTAQVVLSVWVVVSYPDDFGSRVWSNPIHWVDNPKAAPPSTAGGALAGCPRGTGDG